jgi:hypothetical protein
MPAADYLLLRSILRQGFFAFAHRFTFEFQPMGSAQESIQQGISDSWGQGLIPALQPALLSPQWTTMCRHLCLAGLLID